jgi:hypothetical protein
MGFYYKQIFPIHNWVQLTALHLSTLECHNSHVMLRSKTALHSHLFCLPTKLFLCLLGFEAVAETDSSCLDLEPKPKTFKRRNQALYSNIGMYLQVHMVLLPRTPTLKYMTYHLDLRLEYVRSVSK